MALQQPLAKRPNRQDALQKILQRPTRIDAHELEMRLDLGGLGAGLGAAEQLAQATVGRQLDDEHPLAAAKGVEREGGSGDRFPDPALARHEQQATIEDRMKRHPADATRRSGRCQFTRRPDSC